MRLHELFLTQEDKDKIADKKSMQLKRSIEDGDMPEIHNASGVMSGYAWGDLEQLGLAKRESEDGSSQYHVRQRWVYSKDAPGPIKLLTRFAKISSDGTERGVNDVIMKPGDATDWVDVDVS